MTDTITLFHSPRSRSTGTLILLEELGAPYELRVLNRHAGEQRQPEFLAINPVGKVPAILHGEAVVTEQVAITAADVLWGTALRWTTMFGLIPPSPVISAYVERVSTRPAAVRAKGQDAALAAQHNPS
jgi:glutathione S-transferase